MKYVTKELVGMTIVLVSLFLILTNSTGAARTIGALGKNYAQVVRSLQGRR